MGKQKMLTEQLNIRLSQELIQDLDLVSCLLKVNKSEWIKTRLAEEVHKEKNRLLLELSTLYAKGMITRKQVKELVGEDVARQMESTQKTASRSIKEGLRYGKRLKRKLHS
ncbi:MAG: hypothetical protein ABIB71_05855 [Candidatus Woesearchaeota archaeon]